jgi:MoxR-like ATPase
MSSLAIAPTATSSSLVASTPQPSAKTARITSPLGLHGWDHLESVLLAALITEEPLLLIGKHGTAKSLLLERLAESLGLDYRFYNASLVNYDDLVGIPIPNAEQTALRYISTPTAIWDAEVVFFDEINRTRPDLQNKLFSIVHERRIQGIPLRDLKYRWAAMNPPASDDAGSDDIYHGVEPLDPALADRFGFLIEVPDWCDLSNGDKRAVLLDRFKGRHAFKTDLPDLLAKGRRHFQTLCSRPPDLGDYFLSLEAQLKVAGHRLSTRRLTTLYRTGLGVHAARLAIVGDTPERRVHIDLETSLMLAVLNGHPGRAYRTVDQAALLGVHRFAWGSAALRDDDPWKELLSISDPLERLIHASNSPLKLNETDFSNLVLEAISSEKVPEFRRSIALAIYLKERSRGSISATTAEVLASLLQRVVDPANERDSRTWNKVHPYVVAIQTACKGKPKGLRDRYARNLMNAFFPQGSSLNPEDVHSHFLGLWDRLQIPAA